MRTILVSATGIRKGYPHLGTRKNKEVLPICVGSRQKEDVMLVIRVHAP